MPVDNAKNKPTYLYQVRLHVLVILILAGCSPDKEEFDFENLQAQPSGERRVAGSVSGLYDSARVFIDSAALYNPTELYQYDQAYYVVDKGGMTVRKYDVEGDFVVSFGQGEGQAPEEFMGIQSVYSSHKGVYIVDKTKVVRFDSLGALTGVYTSEEPFQNALMLNDSVIVDYHLPDRLAFRYYAIQGGRIRLKAKSGALIQDQETAFVSISGASLSRVDDHSFVIIPLFGGIICRYDRMEKTYCRTTIAPRPLPELLSRLQDGGVLQFKNEKDMQGAQRIISINNNIMGIIRTDNEQGHVTCYLDTYALADGAYISSIAYDRCMQRGRPVFMDDDALLTLDGDHFTMWKRKKVN